MHETASRSHSRSFSRMSLVSLGLAAATLIPSFTRPAMAGQAPGFASSYGVVLTDGTTIPAASRPLILMGMVSFLDGGHHSRSLAVTSVNVAATQAHNGSFGVLGASRHWDARALASLDRHAIQFASGDGGSSNEDPGPPTSPEQIRGEIERMEKLAAPLSGTDHMRTVYMMREQELREELNRILTPTREEHQNEKS